MNTVEITEAYERVQRLLKNNPESLPFYFKVEATNYYPIFIFFALLCTLYLFKSREDMD